MAQCNCSVGDDYFEILSGCGDDAALSICKCRSISVPEKVCMYLTNCCAAARMRSSFVASE